MNQISKALEYTDSDGNKVKQLADGTKLIQESYIAANGQSQTKLVPSSNQNINSRNQLKSHKFIDEHGNSSTIMIPQEMNDPIEIEKYIQSVHSGEKSINEKGETVVQLPNGSEMIEEVFIDESGQNQTRFIPERIPSQLDEFSKSSRPQLAAQFTDSQGNKISRSHSGQEILEESFIDEFGNR